METRGAHATNYKVPRVLLIECPSSRAITRHENPRCVASSELALAPAPRGLDFRGLIGGAATHCTRSGWTSVSSEVTELRGAPAWRLI